MSQRCGNLFISYNWNIIFTITLTQVNSLNLSYIKKICGRFIHQFLYVSPGFL